MARQVEHARAYATRKGWTVAPDLVLVDDGISGAESANRPGFLRLMNSLKPHPAFQALVMSEESRPAGHSWGSPRTGSLFALGGRAARQISGIGCRFAWLPVPGELIERRIVPKKDLSRTGDFALIARLHGENPTDRDTRIIM